MATRASVGHKDDPNARQLFQTALQVSIRIQASRMVGLDREGTLPNPDVEYPELKRAAAFVCTERSCSSPIVSAGQLLAKAEKLAQ